MYSSRSHSCSFLVLKVNFQDFKVRQKIIFVCDYFVIFVFFVTFSSLSNSVEICPQGCYKSLNMWIVYFSSILILLHSVSSYPARARNYYLQNRWDRTDNGTIRTKTLMGHHWRQFYCLQASFLIVSWWAKKGNWLWRRSSGGR